MNAVADGGTVRCRGPFEFDDRPVRGKGAFEVFVQDIAWQLEAGDAGHSGCDRLDGDFLATD